MNHLCGQCLIMCDRASTSSCLPASKEVSGHSLALCLLRSRSSECWGLETSSLMAYSGGGLQPKCRNISMDCLKRCFHKLLGLLAALALVLLEWELFFRSCHHQSLPWSLEAAAEAASTSGSSSPQLSRRPSLCQSWEEEPLLQHGRWKLDHYQIIHK